MNNKRNMVDREWELMTDLTDYEHSLRDRFCGWNPKYNLLNRGAGLLYSGLGALVASSGNLPLMTIGGGIIVNWYGRCSNRASCLFVL